MPDDSEGGPPLSADAPCLLVRSLANADDLRAADVLRLGPACRTADPSGPVVVMFTKAVSLIWALGPTGLEKRYEIRGWPVQVVRPEKLAELFDELASSGVSHVVTDPGPHSLIPRPLGDVADRFRDRGD